MPSRVREGGLVANVVKRTLGVDGFQHPIQGDALITKVGQRINRIAGSGLQLMVPGTYEWIKNNSDKDTMSDKNGLISVAFFLTEMGFDIATFITAMKLNLAILAAKPVYNAGVATVFESIRAIKNRKSTTHKPVIPAA